MRTGAPPMSIPTASLDMTLMWLWISLGVVITAITVAILVVVSVFDARIEAREEAARAARRPTAAEEKVQPLRAA